MDILITFFKNLSKWLQLLIFLDFLGYIRAILSAILEDKQHIAENYIVFDVFRLCILACS